MNEQEEELDGIAFIFYGRFSAQLEAYASSKQVPLAELVRRLAGLFSAASGGSLLGVENHLPYVRRQTAANRRRDSSPALALASRSHRAPSGKTQVKRGDWHDEAIRLQAQGVYGIDVAKRLKVSASAVYSLFERLRKKEKKHWSQRPENRAAIMRRVRAMNKARREKQ
jgi:hypothetical protein